MGHEQKEEAALCGSAASQTSADCHIYGMRACVSRSKSLPPERITALRPQSPYQRRKRPQSLTSGFLSASIFTIRAKWQNTEASKKLPYSHLLMQVPHAWFTQETRSKRETSKRKIHSIVGRLWSLINYNTNRKVDSRTRRQEGIQHLRKRRGENETSTDVELGVLEYLACSL